MDKRYFYALLASARRVNRALHLDNTTGVVAHGDLSTDDSQGFGPDDLYLPSAWEIELRVCINAPSPDDYQAIFARLAGSSAEYSIFYQGSSGRFAFDSFQYNASGGLIYKELPVSAPMGAFHIVRYAYDGTTLRGYLNGALAYSENIVLGLVNTRGGILSIGFGNTSTYQPNMDLDYLKITRAGQLIVHLDFNESTGPARNRGTLGGRATWANDSARVLL